MTCVYTIRASIRLWTIFGVSTCFSVASEIMVRQIHKQKTLNGAGERVCRFKSRLRIIHATGVALYRLLTLECAGGLQSGAARPPVAGWFF